MVIKSQILAGGRGLGKFKNGLQGGVHIVDKVKALELAKQVCSVSGMPIEGTAWMLVRPLRASDPDLAGCRQQRSVSVLRMCRCSGRLW